MGWLASLVATAVAGITGLFVSFGIAPFIKNYEPPPTYEYVEAAPSESNNYTGLEEEQQVKEVITPNSDQEPIDIAKKPLGDTELKENDGRINALSD